MYLQVHYEWVRASVTYQKYDVVFNINNVPLVGDLPNQSGTIASFVGFNTYLTNVTPRVKTLAVNDDKKQGFWVFETNLSAPYAAYNQVTSGDAPAGATTVVNPLFDSSPIPPGSCVVTGKFATPLVVTGKETKRYYRVAFLFDQQQFRMERHLPQRSTGLLSDGITPSEQIVDMGLRR